MATQKLYPQLISNPEKTPLEIAQELNLIQDSDEDSIKSVIQEVLIQNAAKVQEYKSGKKGLMGMFMGQVMKKSQGKADPKVANKILTELLDN